MGTRIVVGAGLTALIISASLTLGVELAAAEGRPASVRLPVQRVEYSEAPTLVTVGKGDHLWKIARSHLEAVRGEEQSRSQIARYWQAVIAMNLDRLRSGDPDLIYPGEVISLPADPISGPP